MRPESLRRRQFTILITNAFALVKLIWKTADVTLSVYAKRHEIINKVAEKLPDPQERDDDFAKHCLARDGSKCVISGTMGRAREAMAGDLGEAGVTSHNPLFLGGFESKVLSHAHLTCSYIQQQKR